jgi:membrane associated rhomboid family serine protease
LSQDLLLGAHATLVLLAANILISLAAFNSPSMTDQLLLYMRPIRAGRQLYRVISSGFVHGDGLHLFMNMLTLFFFGPYLEYVVGTVWFVIIYFAALLAGSALAIVENFRNLEYRALGASGAISGVTVAFAMFQPFATLLIFFVPMWAIVYAVLYIAFSAFAARRFQDGIGHEAHLGGALAGVVIVCLVWPNAVRELWDEVLSRLGVL